MTARSVASGRCKFSDPGRLSVNLPAACRLRKAHSATCISFSVSASELSGCAASEVFPGRITAAVRLKNAADFGHELPHHLVARAGLREFARELVQCRGAFLAVALGQFLRADTGHQLAQHNGHDKIKPEQNTVLGACDDEREASAAEKNNPKPARSPRRQTAPARGPERAPAKRPPAEKQSPARAAR